ncbi:MAG: hypothetical protein ACYSSO_00025 [Planctomycetota bacterium]
MNSICHLALLTVVLAICLLCSCRQNPGGVVEDSNNFSSSILCWDQSWECGEWEPLELDSTESIRTWDAINAGDGTYWSICDNCGSIRIFDIGSKKERTLLSPRSRLRPCDYKWAAGLSEKQLVLYGFDPIVGEHKWIAGLSRRSFDLIEAGDVLVAQQGNYLFVFMIQNILGVALDDQRVEYRVARFGVGDRFPIKIDLSVIKWKTSKSYKAFPIGGRKIEFDLFPTILTNNKPRFVEIFYDQYYGGSDGPEAVMGSNVAKIAIIHKDDLAGNSIIDLRQYRFKSWEDGMGNSCEESLINDQKSE